MSQVLIERSTFGDSHLVLEHAPNQSGSKDLFMKGIFVQGDVRNRNKRIYPLSEITRAVGSLQEQIARQEYPMGQLDHPDHLTIDLDRVTHVITEMWMEDNSGMGKLKLIPTPMGQIARTMLEAGVRLGVSSRGSGNVDHNGYVSGFEIVTVDIVATPSAPNAYPNAIYEGLWNHRTGNKIYGLAQDRVHDPKAEKALLKEMQSLFDSLRLK